MNKDAKSLVDEIRDEEFWKLIELKKFCLTRAEKTDRVTPETQLACAQKFFNWMIDKDNFIYPAEWIGMYTYVEQQEDNEQDKHKRVLDLTSIPISVLEKIAMIVLNISDINSCVNIKIYDGEIDIYAEGWNMVGLIENGNIYFQNSYQVPTEAIQKLLKPYWKYVD